MAKNTKRSRRPTFGSDPLDAMVPDPAEAAASSATKATKASKRGLAVSASKAKPATKPRAAKVRATFHLPEDLLDQARDAVYWTPGVSMASLCEKGLRAELAKLERKRGEPFPRRESELKGGRPIGS